jgi:hypothetical protein
MSYVDVTFEGGGDLVKTIARVSAGWDGSKVYQFYSQQMVDFKSDIKLRVAVWLSASTLLRDFSEALRATHDEGLMKAAITHGRLSLSVLFHPDLPWIKTSNGKFAVDWQVGQIAVHENVTLQLRHMIVFNLPSPKRGDYREWDLLPFLPGGLLESNRRRH